MFRYLFLSLFCLFFYSCDLSKPDVEEAKKEKKSAQDQTEEEEGVTKKAEGLLKTDDDTFSSKIKVNSNVISTSAFDATIKKLDYRIKSEDAIFALDPVEIQLGEKSSENFTLDKNLSYAIPASAIPASAIPSSGVSGAIPASAIPASMTSLKYQTEEAKIYCLAFFIDALGNSLGTPFNTSLKYEAQTKELDIIISPKMLSSKNLTGNMRIYLTLFVITEEESVTINDIEISKIPYEQKELQAIEILSMKKQDTKDIFSKAAFMVETKNFSAEGIAYLTQGENPTQYFLTVTKVAENKFLLLVPKEVESGKYILHLESLGGDGTKELTI